MHASSIYYIGYIIGVVEYLIRRKKIDKQNYACMERDYEDKMHVYLVIVFGIC